MSKLAGIPPVTRRQLLQGSAAMAAASYLTGCGLKTVGITSPYTANAQPVPSGPLTQATVSIASTSAGTIAPMFTGISFEKAQLYVPLFTATNTNLINLFQRLGPGILRIGGNSTDQNVWAPTGKGQTAGQIAPSDVNSLAAFLTATGWQCLYGINLGGAGTGPSATAPTTTTLATEEAAYVTQALGSSLYGFEIGNECDSYGGSYFPSTWNLAEFVTLWQQYRSAIIAGIQSVNPNSTAIITGPASASHETSWTVPFAADVTGSEISLLTQHYYRGAPSNPTPTASNLISYPDTYLNSCLSELQAGAAAINVPFRMSECNSYYDGGAAGVSNAYAASLWIIDYLFSCALGGAAGVNFHTGNSSNYALIQNTSAGVVSGPYPPYFGAFFFTLAGTGTLNTTTVSAGSLNVSAYAVQNPVISNAISSTPGQTVNQMSVVVVNKDPTQNLQISVQLPQNYSQAAMYEMTQLTTGASGPSLSATGAASASGITIQGASLAVNGAWPFSVPYTPAISGSQLTCYVPALSAVLIRCIS